MQKTELVTVYRPSDTTLSDGDSVPNAVTKIKATYVNIHRGTQEAVALAYGVTDRPPAIAFGNVPDKALFATRNVIVDAAGDCWLIEGKPSARNRFPATAHVKMLLGQLIFPPDGIGG